MSQNLPPNNNSAQNDFEVNFDFLDGNADSTPKKSIGDELDDLSFLDSLDDSTSISAPPPTSPNKQGANDGFDDFLSSLDNDPIDEVKPAKNQLDDELVAAAPMAKKPSSKFKDKEAAAKPKKSLFSFGKKGDDKQTDDKKAAPAKPKKSLFSFGKKGDDKKAAPAKAKKSAFGADKKADDKSAADKPKKSLFSFGKKEAAKPADKPKKSGGLGFGKKDDVKATDKAAKPVAGKPAAGGKAAKAPTNKKTLWLALGALLAVALLFMAWTMMNSEESASFEDPTAPTVTASPSPAVPADGGVTVPSAPAPDEQAGQVPAVQPVQPAPAGQPAAADQNTAATTNNAQADANANKNAPLVTGAPAIDTDAIVKAEVPQDPALIKEEIDRLNDKNGQFQEQAKIIDEQLGKLEELTVAKEEKIALLEAQIAQLEAQKKK